MICEIHKTRRKKIHKTMRKILVNVQDAHHTGKVER